MRTPLLATAALIVAACQSGLLASVEEQVRLEARVKPTLISEGLVFKDLNANGELDLYEDWRAAPHQRAANLVSLMTLEEKAGVMLIATQNPDCDGTITEDGLALMTEQHMSRFIVRAVVTTEPADCSIRLQGWRLRGGYNQTPRQMIEFMNAVQEVREASRLGIPAIFKDNPRNHVENQPRFGIGVEGGVLTEFPKPAGIAAAALGAVSPPDIHGTVPETLPVDAGIIQAFAEVVGEEWRALGIRGMYGYTIDLATEPRWSRIHETFSEDAGITAAIVSDLVLSLQGPPQANGLALSPQTDVSLTIKHFPGGGPQYMGWDPHYTFGKSQIYPSADRGYGFDYHLKPFIAAIDAGVAAIMPYYGVPTGARREGEAIEELGMAFSEQIISDLLRNDLGFRGYVNSDSGIVQERSWGFEDFRINAETGRPYDINDRIAASVSVGTDIFSEFSKIDPVVSLVSSGRLDEARDVDPAVTRLLVEQFALGLFETPYTDIESSVDVVGSPEHEEVALEIQRRSIVLLKNDPAGGEDAVLPLKPDASVYVFGFDAGDLRTRGYNVISAMMDSNGEAARQPVPEGTDVALINVEISTSGTLDYRSDEPGTGGRKVGSEFELIDGRTGLQQETWGAQDPCVYHEPAEAGVAEAQECLDDMLIFGGPFPWEINTLSISGIAGAESWKMTPSLEQVREIYAEIGDPARVVLTIEFRNPYVLDEASGFLDAGALLATFGVSDAAQLDIVQGIASPQGRLPFALAKTGQAILEQAPDAPGYEEARDGALFPLGYGLTYARATMEKLD